MATSRRNPWLAALAGLFVLGLGQVYNGQWRKGAALATAGVLFPGVALVLLTASASSPLGMLLVLGIGFALWLIALVDAVRTARRLGPGYELKHYNRVVVYIGIALAFAIVKAGQESYLRAHVLQAFRVPSESMLPTLLVGDNVYVDRSAAALHPMRGAVIAYRPSTRRDAIYLKRVVALEGDTVELRDKNLALNGQPIHESYVIHIDPMVHPATFDPRDNFGPLTLTPGSCFVLGDNRDNSNDSRFSGPLAGADIVGTARWIYWSWDGDHERVRWERIGKRL